MCYLFTFFIVIFEGQSFLISVKSSLSIFFMSYTFGVISRKALPKTHGHEHLHPCSSKNVTVLALIVRS